MAWVWNVIDCENQDREFVDQSLQPDYDIAGNTWTNTQTPGTLTEASTSVTRTSRYSASNTIALDNSVYSDVWDGVFKSTGTERKQADTPVSDFTHKNSSVSLQARGGFSASDGSAADDVLGFRTVELEGSSIDLAMGGSFKADGKGAFRVDGLLTAEDGLSFDGLVNSDILGWFGSNSLSISVDSSGSTFRASNSDINEALVGFENVTLSGRLDSDANPTMLILGGKTSLSADVTLKEAVDATGVKFNASVFAELSVKSIGSAEIYDTDATAIVGYADLTIGDGADVDAAIGGNLNVTLSASGKATVVVEDDSTVVSYAEGSASLSASLKSTGEATVFGGSADVGTLVGYRQVAVSGANVGVIVGGNLSIEAGGGVELANLNTDVIENISNDPSLENLMGLLESLQSISLGVSVSLKSTGQANLTGYMPETLRPIEEYSADVDAVIGYENFAANQGSYAGLAIGGDLSVSVDAGVEGGIDAKLSARSQAKGKALLQDSEINVLVGYRDLAVENGEVRVGVGGNLALTVKGGFDLGSILDLDTASASLASIGSASLANSDSDALVGYRDVTLTDSGVSVLVGGNCSGDLDAVVSLGALAFSGALSLQSKAVGTLTIDSDEEVSSLNLALGYRDVVIRGSEAGVVIGGNLNVDVSADYPSPFELAGNVSLTSLEQATVSDSSVAALVGYRDLSVTGGSVGYAVGGDISASLSVSQEDASASFSLFSSSKGQANLTQTEASALIGYRTLSLNNSAVDVAVGGIVSVKAGLTTSGSDELIDLKADLTSTSSATLINGSEANVLIGYRNLSVNASTIGELAIGGVISFSGDAVLTIVEDSESSLLDITGKLSVTSDGSAAITNRSTVGNLVGYRTVTIERNSTAGNLIGGNLSGTLSATGSEVDTNELNGYLTALLGGIAGGDFELPDDNPFEGLDDEILFSGSWKSTGSVAVTGGTVDNIYSYSTVTLNYVTVDSANGGNYRFTDAPLSSFDFDNPDACTVSAAGQLTGTELDINDITGFKKIQITGGSVSGAVSATSSVAGDLAQRSAVFSVLDVEFCIESSLSGYGKVIVDGAYNSAMALVMTTDGSDHFTLQGNAGLYVETFLFGAGNDKLLIRGDSTLYADSIDFGSGKDVLEVAAGSQLNFYGSSIDGLEKITGKGTIAVTNEDLAEALRQLTSTATILYNPLLEPAGFTGVSLQLESDAAYSLDAGTTWDALATATGSTLFGDEQKSGVLGAMIA